MIPKKDEIRPRTPEAEEAHKKFLKRCEVELRRKEIREGMNEILGDDLINFGFTHENPPPHKDCSEECGVSLDDQIAAANPIMSPVRSGGKKHKKCMDCWEEYIDGLIARIQVFENSQGVAIIDRDRELPEGDIALVSDRITYLLAEVNMLRAGFVATISLIEEENENN